MRVRGRGRRRLFGTFFTRRQASAAEFHGVLACQLQIATAAHIASMTPNSNTPRRKLQIDPEAQLLAKLK